MKKIILSFVVLAAFSSCKNKVEKVDKLKSADWLLGKWEHKMEQGNLSESWERVNDGTFAGHSFFIKGKDTLHFESMELKQKGMDLWYITTVEGQNHDNPIELKMTSSTAGQLVFENVKQDYPKKIIYNIINKDSLVATVSGILQGKQSIEKYAMSKK